MSRNKEESLPWKPEIGQKPGSVKGDNVNNAGFIVMMLLLLSMVTFMMWMDKSHPDPSPTVAENSECE